MTGKAGKRKSIPDEKANGYIILTLKEEKIIVANADTNILNLLNTVVKRHVNVIREGWVREMTYFYKMNECGRHTMIQLVADSLMILYKSGWQPLTPINVASKSKKQKMSRSAKTLSQVAICFVKNEDLLSTSSDTTNDGCLCIETYRNTYVGFHNVNNNNLLDLVQTIQDVWDPGVVGVSDGVMSVIKDYCRPSPPLLSGYSLDIQQNKFLKLSSLKYKQEEDSELYKYKHQDSLFRALVACLTKAEYKLGMDVSFDSSSRIFFFMKTQELKVNKEIKLPNMIGAGLGEKEDLAVYRPLLKRQKSSFLRSFRSKPNVTKLRREVKASLRRKATLRSSSSTPWWQQSSIDSNNSEDK